MHDADTTANYLTVYFCADVKDSKPGTPVFNRIVTLKDTWAKIVQQGKK
jgi:glutaminyl-tRNA synthetase